jgi:hypothetical protein
MEKQEQSWLLPSPDGMMGEVKASSKDVQNISKIFPKV